MHKTNLLACATAFTACVSANTGTNRTVPANGVELLTRMHDGSAGKWDRTLALVQKTTVTRPTGVVDTSTWYEALKSPDRLRIDFGDPSKGNGALYPTDSLYVVRGGKVARTIPSGNPFLPFVAGVYGQPVDTTLRQLSSWKFDLSKIRTDTWQGAPVYVVGANSPQDVDSPQFWVEREHLQAEDYSDWHGDVALGNDFFVAEKWSDTPHWFSGKKRRTMELRV